MSSKTRERIRAAAQAALDAGDDAGSNETEASPEIPDKLYFRIGEVARLVGVDSHVLRYWESEFKMKPHRSSSGQRLYRKPDLARFLRIKHLLHEEGYTIAGARKALSGGAEAGGVSSADLGRIKDALERVENLRFSIQDFMVEVAPE